MGRALPVCAYGVSPTIARFEAALPSRFSIQGSACFSEMCLLLLYGGVVSASGEALPRAASPVHISCVHVIRPIYSQL